MSVDTEVLRTASFEGSSRRNSDLARTVEAVAPGLAGLLLAIPVLVAYYPPMTDLPFHEGAIGVLRHFSDTTMFPPGLYERNLGHPNQLFHVIGWALSYVVSTRWAVKLVVAATVMAIPIAAARFARHVGASPLAALLVSPLALGWLFAWGLVTNLLGLALLLALIPALDRLAEAPSGRRSVAAVLASVLLYFAHGAMMAAYAGAALGLALLYPWSKRKTPLRLAPFVVGVALALAEAMRVKHLDTAAVRAIPSVWHTVGHKLLHIPYMLLPATDGVVYTAMFGLCVLIVGLFFWLRWRERRQVALQRLPSATERHGVQAWAVGHRWEIFALACLAAYLAFPLTLHGATLVYQRWFPPGFAVLVVVAAPRDLWTRDGRVARFAVALFPMATLLVAWPSFVDSDRQYLALEQALPYVERGSGVVGIDLGPHDPSRTFTLSAAAGRILATRGGRLAYAFTDSPISPVFIPRRFQWSEALLRLGFDSFSLRPAHDLRRFRYVLLHVNDPGLAQLATSLLQPEADHIMTSGEWVLLRSHSETLPLASREGRIMGPPPENLRDRLILSVKEGTGRLPERPPDAPGFDPIHRY
ncbi:MAG: hypothetical protein M3O36_11850 [Myxococcota bacterium]|nr:hypothetical protein [Myxococcota bacterium]